VSWLNNTATDISGYDDIVLKLAEASTSEVEINLSTGGFWGGIAAGKLAAGETEITIALSSVSDIDLTAVNLVFLRSGWVTTQTIALSEFYLIKNSEETGTDTGDDSKETTASDFKEIDITGGAVYEGSATADGSVITFTNGGDKWGYDLSGINTSLYKYLVIVPKAPYLTDGKQFLYGLTDGTNTISDWGFAYGFYQQRRATVINLTDKVLYEDYNESATCKTFAESEIDMSKLQKFFINATDASSEFELSAIYFTNTAPTYDNRWNFVQADFTRDSESADTYGTVCLPYAAAVCGATIYKAVGVDAIDNPSSLYLEEVSGILEPGVPYIFKSNTAKASDIEGGAVTFYRAGANEVSAPVDNALIGSFSDTSVPETSYVINNNKWVKGSNNTITANRAYLTLTEDLVVPEAESAKYIAMPIGGDATAITSVAEKAIKGDIYSISGVKVANPQTGLYIQNGKKYIVK